MGGCSLRPRWERIGWGWEDMAVDNWFVEGLDISS